jgi:mycothiol system anti-sigma-R factor
MNACGDSSEVNCSEVVAEVYLLLDHECQPEHEALLRKHLDDCPPCLEEYGIDEHLKQLLARKCGGDQAPAELKERLRETIRKKVEERSSRISEVTSAQDATA